jgi:hypothetical protein
MYRFEEPRHRNHPSMKFVWDVCTIEAGEGQQDFMEGGFWLSWNRG